MLNKVHVLIIISQPYCDILTYYILMGRVTYDTLSQQVPLPQSSINILNGHCIVVMTTKVAVSLFFTCFYLVSTIILLFSVSYLSPPSIDFDDFFISFFAHSFHNFIPFHCESVRNSFLSLHILYHHYDFTLITLRRLILHFLVYFIVILLMML